ncbi:hypothetical protein B0H13DRAFT_2565097 [Mycena leptocephala]|nr:hypothetical protein B0H13DRAFT_2565097 [Mycena leptocephala]
MQLGGQERVGFPVIRPMSVVRARRRSSSPPRYPPDAASTMGCMRSLSRRPTARTGIGHRRSPGEKQIRGANAQVGMPPTRPIMDAWCAPAARTVPHRARDTTASREVLGELARAMLQRTGWRQAPPAAQRMPRQRAMVRQTQRLHDSAQNEAWIGPIRVKRVDKIEGRVHGSASSRGGELETGMKWEAASEGGMKLFPSVGVAGLKYPFGRGAVRKARVRGVEHRGRVVDDHVAGACESRVGGNAFDRAEGRSTGRQREGGDGREVGVRRIVECTGAAAVTGRERGARTRRVRGRDGARAAVDDGGGGLELVLPRLKSTRIKDCIIARHSHW